MDESWYRGWKRTVGMDDEDDDYDEIIEIEIVEE